MDNNESLGIPNYGPWYINADEGRKEIEFHITNKFIIESLKNLNIDINNSKLEFINYGSMELVYVLKTNDEMYTVLVSQPKTGFGKLHSEYNNLIKLNEKHKEVIKPLIYLSNNKLKKELYITQYLYQARCIGINPMYNKWGIWIPEPNYHYYVLTKEVRKKLNTCMLAEILRLYDDEEKIGLSEISLGSGDFTLNKNLNSVKEKDIINSLNLIAARKLIKMDYETYIENLTKELTSDSKRLICKKNLQDKFTKEEIYDGIKLGNSLRNKDKKLILKK